MVIPGSNFEPIRRIEKYQIHLRQVRQDISTVRVINHDAGLLVIRYGQAHPLPPYNRIASRQQFKPVAKTQYSAMILYPFTPYVTAAPALRVMRMRTK